MAVAPAPAIERAGPQTWEAALLDAIPDATAVLDTDGVIVAVNHAWSMFTLDNGGSVESTGVGVGYLGVCERSAAAGCTDAADVVSALKAVLAGEAVERDLEYPCPSPAAGRWYALRVTKINWPEPGLLVTHSNISVRKMSEQALERQASQDPLTGLANRNRFTQRLASALTPRANGPTTSDVGVLYLDLNGFKPVNDTYGHGAGDEVLQVVATRLSAVCRPQDTVARLGGDEFAVVAPRITSSGLAGLAHRIQEALVEPHSIHGRQVVVGASVGSCLASAGDSVADCLQRADEAMYAVKRKRVVGAQRTSSM